jgi:hypothetical protein
MGIATQWVMGRSLDTLFCGCSQNTNNYSKMNGLRRILGKLGDQRAFKRLSPIEPTNDVTVQLSLAKIRPNGIFHRFNRSHKAFRTALSSHCGGR